MKQTLLLLLVFFTAKSVSQQRCGTTERTKKLLQNNKECTIAKQKVNPETQKWIEETLFFLSKKIIKIPVLVHVIYKTTVQNISQFDVLNRDFRKLNIDTINTPSEWKQIASDYEIEFCLAKTDPNRNSTTGITRTQKSTT